MKIKSKFLITIVLLCFTSLVTIAKDLSVFSVEVVDKNSFAVQLKNVKEAQIVVSLKDAKGVLLHKETFMQNRLDNRMYNLGELPSGGYTLVVVYDTVIKVQEIKKGYEILEIEAENLKTIFQPSFRQHSGFLDLNMLTLFDLKYSLEISDGAGNLIYNELVQPERTLHKRFDLSHLDKGSYVFTIRIMDDVLNNEFTKLIELSPTIAAL